VSTFAGAGKAGYVDGEATAAMFRNPYGITIDKEENLYVTDFGNHLIRKITSTGKVTTLAGSVRGTLDGNASAAQFYSPTGVTLDDNGILLISDYCNHKIRKLTQGIVTTIAGSSAGYVDGPCSEALFRQPTDIVVDNHGNIIVTESGNHLIRRIL